MLEILWIADEELPQRRGIEYSLRRNLHGYRIAVHSMNEAMRRLRATNQPPPDLALLDTAAGDAAAVQRIREIRAACPPLPVIVLTPYGADRHAQEAVDAGAADFLCKPVSPERLKLTIQNVMKIQRMGNQLARVERIAGGYVDFADIVGNAPALRRAIAQGRQVAASRLPVMIVGEPGTGKELLARAIHGASNRAGKPFVTVNARMLPDNAQALQFGHDAAAGTPHFMPGKLREAEGGTLFIKEAGLLPPGLLQRLSAALQRGEVTQPDTPAPQAVDVRLICSSADHCTETALASHDAAATTLSARVAAIALPSLSERREDIPLLARHLAGVHTATENRNLLGLSIQALEYLAANAWPGNVRQLSNLLWRSVLMCHQDTLDVGDIRLIQQLQPAYNGASESAALAGPLLFDTHGRIRKLRCIEDEVIRNALRLSGGCMSRAARTLGIGRSTLYRRLGELKARDSIQQYSG